MVAKIRTMCMTPFYLFSGVLLVYIFQKQISLKKLKYFFSVFLFLFIFSPFAYLYISITQTDKRTDYPGKEIAQLVEEQWKNNFTNNIGLVGGDEWHGGNLSYHIETRPIYPDLDTAKHLKCEGNFHNSRVFGKEGLVLPCGPDQSNENIQFVLDTLKSYS